MPVNGVKPELQGIVADQKVQLENKRDIRFGLSSSAKLENQTDG